MIDRSVVEYHPARMFIALLCDALKELDDSGAVDRRAREMVSQRDGAEVERLNNERPQCKHGSTQ